MTSTKLHVGRRSASADAAAAGRRAGAGAPDGNAPAVPLDGHRHLAREQQRQGGAGGGPSVGAEGMRTRSHQDAAKGDARALLARVELRGGLRRLAAQGELCAVEDHRRGTGRDARQPRARAEVERIARGRRAGPRT